MKLLGLKFLSPKWLVTERPCPNFFLLFFFSNFCIIRYHGSSSSIKCHEKPNQISCIFVINRVPCVSSCWGRRHTHVVCNESREYHTRHYPSRPVAKRNNQQTTHTSHYRSRLVEGSVNAAMI